MSKRSKAYLMRKELEQIKAREKEITEQLKQAEVPVYWSTSKAAYIPVKDMNTEHIINAINKSEYLDETVIAMIMELGRRGLSHLDILV